MTDQLQQQQAETEARLRDQRLEVQRKAEADRARLAAFYEQRRAAQK